MANEKKDSVSGIRLSYYEEGIESMCKILEEERREGRLLKDGREVDILKSLKEPGYQERLLMEYNL